MIKLIATDLDGTLFHPRRLIHGITNRNRYFLRDFLDNGNDLLLASGRCPSIVDNMEHALKHRISFLGCNGGFLYEDGKVFNPLPLDRERILELTANSYESFGIAGWLLFDDSEYISALLTKNTPAYIPWIAPFSRMLTGFYNIRVKTDRKNFWDTLAHKNTYKLQACFGFGEKHSQETNQAYLAMTTRYKDVFSIVVSGIVIEITNPKANKGDGVMAYCREHGIAPDEVFVIGDSGNDLTMFSRFPHSFAMANAPKHIQEGANHVVKGVYELQHYLDHPELLEGDTIKTIDYDKALSNII